MALGQLTHLPEEIAANPFSPLLVRFSRLKAGSWERLFLIEAVLVRWSWLALLLLLGLVYLPLEEVDYVSTLVRLATLIYPCFFIWSLTRLSGVELMQLVLEGQWTADLLATPMSERELTVGLASPIWITVRQYFLITFFSLVLYGLETGVFVQDPSTGEWLVDELIRNTIFHCEIFFCGAAWILFLYTARLFSEVRLRNGLLKGLLTLALLMGGVVLLVVFGLLFTIYSYRMTDDRVLGGLAAIAAGLTIGAAWLHRLLSRNFRRYLAGQLDIDFLIYDVADPQASGWERPADAEPKTTGDGQAQSGS
jgi:hypothetical protein